MEYVIKKKLTRYRFLITKPTVNIQTYFINQKLKKSHNKVNFPKLILRGHIKRRIARLSNFLKYKKFLTTVISFCPGISAYVDIVSMDFFLDKKTLFKILKIGKSGKIHKKMCDIFESNQKFCSRKVYEQLSLTSASRVGVLLISLLKNTVFYPKFILFFRGLVQSICTNLFNDKKF